MPDVPTFRSPHARTLYQKVVERSAQTCVMGLGYAGLPLAVEIGRAGFRTLGIDTNAHKCRRLNRGESDVRDVSDTDLRKLIRVDRFFAAQALGANDHPDTMTICVPTPLRKTRDPDLSFIVDAARTVAHHLRPGMLVILESTTYPGTTQEILQPILEKSGLRAGTDFFLAFSPERVDPGNRNWNTRNIPKVVGGLTADCTQLAAAFYGTFIDEVVTVTSPKTAEMAKLLENTFRAINIGLVNEMAVMCDRIGISIWEVIAAASTKPFGFMPFYPGPGLGGHCVPVDPAYLSWKVQQTGMEARFIELATEVNAGMPHYVIEKIGDALNEHGKPIKGSTVLLMGVAYKPEVDDIRESPALDVMALLSKKGANVKYHDPFVPRIAANRWTGGIQMDSAPFTDDEVAAADCVVILTAHCGIDYEALSASARLVVDTRNAIKKPGPHIFTLGAPNPTL